MYYPVISDVEGLKMNAEEKAFFSKHKPFGFILFKRNCDNPEQIKALTQEMRQCVGNDDIAILIDQEGGRVARLTPPHWKKYPAAAAYAKLYENDPALAKAAVQVHASLIANDLFNLGINVDCFPVVDIFYPGADKVIGDRAYGERPKSIAVLGRAGAEAMLSCGIIPIIKHIPGHGRADVDSHLQLPVVDTPLEQLRISDFIPFQKLNDLPCAMTAHVIYSDIDPNRCATISPIVIKEIIRGELNFKGILFSDDISMKALNKPPAQNAVDALKAGCDLALHCNGSFNERQQVILATSDYKLRGERIWEILKRKRKPKNIDHDKIYTWLMTIIKQYE